MFQIEREIPSLDPNIVTTVFGYHLASSTLMIVFIIFLSLMFSVYVKNVFKIFPTSKVQVAFEIIYDSLKDLVNNITSNSKTTEKIFPMIGTMLLYLMVSNIIDLTPGLSDVSYDGKAILTGPTGDFNTTFGLAIGSVIIINILSIRSRGVLPYLGQFFKFKEVYVGFKSGIVSGCVALVEFFVGLLDIVGEFTKVISLSLRLFGNMYAGKVLTLILFGIMAFIIPSTWFAMNLFVGIVQAIVFASLVTAYYTLAIPNESEE